MDTDENDTINEQETINEDAVVELGEDEVPQKGKRKRKRLAIWGIVVGVFAVVLLATGIGGWIWHEDPTFCNAFCHSPMDPYVEGFESGDAALLVSDHAEAGEECLTCHEPTISQQMQELTTWVSGDFKDPLPMTKIGTKEFCMRSGCHDDYAENKALTDNYNGTARNPHDSHYRDALECYTCHRVHRESTLYCNQCHPDMVGPAGWI